MVLASCACTAAQGNCTLHIKESVQNTIRDESTQSIPNAQAAYPCAAYT